IVSNLTGRVAQGEELRSGRYWRRQAREAVRFREGMETLAAKGGDVFIEVGPGAALLGLGRRCLEGDEARWLPPLRAGRPEWEELFGSVARLYERGGEIDWRGVHAGRTRRKVALPTYPFERERYWSDVTTRPAGTATNGGRIAQEGLPHPLLGRRLDVA